MRTVVWQSLSEAQQESILERPAITEGEHHCRSCAGDCESAQ